MNQTLILYPMIALVGWTYIVILQIPFKRFRAVFRKQIVGDDFKFGESQRVPPDVSIPNRNYMNLLELPILFYFVCITLYVTNRVDVVTLILAWAYVATRIVHSLVHLSYNNVLHRFSIFAISNLILALIWILLLMALVGDASA